MFIDSLTSCSSTISPDEPKLSSDSFTLLHEMKTASRVGAFKQYIVGRCSEATFANAFEKQEAIIRYPGGFDSTGELPVGLKAWRLGEDLESMSSVFNLSFYHKAYCGWNLKG